MAFLPWAEAAEAEAEAEVATVVAVVNGAAFLVVGILLTATAFLGLLCSR